MPKHSRHVGQGNASQQSVSHHKPHLLILYPSFTFIALKFLNADAGVPWQRVIASSGKISSRGPGTEGAARQRDALVAEGVDVTETREGEFKVSWREYGWFPERVQATADGEAAGADEEGVVVAENGEVSGNANGEN